MHLRALCASEMHSIRRMKLKNPVAVIPNGIDLPSAKAEVEALKSKAEIPGAEGRKVLLFLGRIHPKKGLANLLEAWGQAMKRSDIGNQKSAEWVLAIAGWDAGRIRGKIKKQK